MSDIETIRAAAPAEARFRTQWTRLLDALAEAGAFVQDDPIAAPDFMQAQSVRYMLRVLRGMELAGLEWDDPFYPRLTRMFDGTLPYPNTNPDCVYFFARISDDGTFHIHGKAGSARVLEVQVMDGHFPAGPNHKSLGTLTDLKGDADGNIRITLSAKPHEGNWLRLEPGAAWIYVRQYHYDWDNEVPADLVIEREGSLLPPPIISADELAARVDRIIGWIPTWYRHLRRRVGTYYDAPEGELHFVTSTAGMDDMRYGKGRVALAPDEVAIVEFRPPACTYWSFQMMNDFWETMDFDLRQTSLNGHQARIDADGVFRAVIAVEDPGVDNWFDPVGNANSLICARVLRAETEPVVSIRKVKRKDLRAELPPETVFLDAAGRHAALRHRAAGVARQFRQ